MNRDTTICNQVDKLCQELKSIFYFSGKSPEIDFYISSLTEYNPFYSTEEICQWLNEANKKKLFEVERIPLAELRKWHFDRWSGDITHESRKFFSIRGLKVCTDSGPVKEWTQPIIDQPETGLLGILIKKINGVLYFLMQIKAEPGNINTFQLSPTVQATRSNYMQVHGGKPTPYLKYFLDKKYRKGILVDQLQSEQGARFYRKRNRNIIIRVRDDEKTDVTSNFRWLTLGQIKKLVLKNNIVNMDARSVLSNISFVPKSNLSLLPIDDNNLKDCLENSPIVSKPLDLLNIKTILSSHSNTPAMHDFDYLIRQISHEKFNCQLDTHLIPLNEVQSWNRTPFKISHLAGNFFSVIGVRVFADNREVSSWDQPIIEQTDPGIVGFIASEFNNVMHFLVQLKMESGNMDLLEIAPTVQCITGSYKKGKSPPFSKEVLNNTQNNIIFDTMQSEEGGRFFLEENRNMLLLINNQQIKEKSRYLWMTMNQLKLFLKFNNFLNIEARSLLSIIP
ncbi:MAG: NDP-hexose 2,3-dehydratase [Candidatus Electrothrix sp. AS4_5]|nr:NDP-hexose 2,3-dehydratase [Candidatus Electrothrix gigas]